ncbi:NADPH dehydrogenase NamA [Soehngenia longivitae]|uniref:NADPH dehydrogenase NamA n=1 Tax=Soehngenia longivitae TaxID=2562294 RepID=A0A4Z0D7A5_9FIRM|nr:NADPH dehydrogenase NamA [Soehngenia longivitae]TFZ40739.1 NADPH dehydrogenase NamA [Soehngenia longivitae]
MLTFQPIKISNLSLKNRIVMPPMCMYSSDDSGFVNEFHKVHYISRAIGGVGLIIQEATSVEKRGRISENDLGIWEDDQVEGLKELVSGIKKHDSKVAIQLAHAGRKCGVKNEDIISCSPINFNDDYKVAREMTIDDIKTVVESFKLAAIRALEADYDALEIHAAHGYLIHQFLSPITNHRSDEYGGSLTNRVKLLKEILISVHQVWPNDRPIILRVSASDYVKDGIDVYMMKDIINQIKDLIDIVHVSSGGLVLAHINIFPGYQVKFAEYLKIETGLPTIAVGLITNIEQVEEILGNNRADLVALGRELLRNPNWVLNNANSSDVKIQYPPQYLRAYK